MRLGFQKISPRVRGPTWLKSSLPYLGNLAVSLFLRLAFFPKCKVVTICFSFCPYSLKWARSTRQPGGLEARQLLQSICGLDRAGLGLVNSCKRRCPWQSLGSAGTPRWPQQRVGFGLHQHSAAVDSCARNTGWWALFYGMNFRAWFFIFFVYVAYLLIGGLTFQVSKFFRQ